MVLGEKALIVENHFIAGRQDVMKRIIQNSTRTLLMVSLTALVSAISISSVTAQAIRLDFGGIQLPGAVAQQSTNSNLESGAILKTDPDLEEVLATAERMKNDGQYRVASQLWQAVLKRSGDALYSSDGENYYSLVLQVEAVLAGLPEEGLSAYRVIADAEAKEIMAAAKGQSDLIALNKVVRQYFISSLGDEAAFELGCIYLDRFDFIGARRMFEKITRQYPDPSVALDEVYVRIALCQSYLGDIQSAKASLELADQAKANNERVNLVRQSLGELATVENNSIVNADWTMPMGDSRRYGTMRAVPDVMFEGDLAAIWQYYFRPSDKYKAADINGAMLTGDQASGKQVLDTVETIESKLIDAWRDKRWRPAGELLLDGDRVFFKTGADLSVWSRTKVAEATKRSEMQSTLDSAISWRSVWRNFFEVDEATRRTDLNRKSWGRGRRTNGKMGGNSPVPSAPAEVNLFGDKVFQQLSIHDNLVYTIEGKQFDDRNKHVSRSVAPQWNASFRRTRENFLTAYDATTGEVKWVLPRAAEDLGDKVTVPDGGDGEDSPWLQSGGFMGSPLGFGDMILVPVNQSGAIYVYALDPSEEGKTIWKSFLCDEPETGAVPWSAINFSIEGSDLFVSCGMGVVFVMDPASGMVRFAKRYRRVGTVNDSARRRGWTVNRLKYDGWSSDVVIPCGRQMICFCSDADMIEAFDRNSGKLIWRTEMNPVGYKVDYVLGVYNDVLYAAGLETIIAYDLKGDGRMLWGTEQLFDGKQSLGRGIVTPKGIYLPVEDSIYHLALEGDRGEAKVLARVHVDLGTEAPVGNLYSDGERFWVHGANRLYALGPKQ